MGFIESSSNYTGPEAKCIKQTLRVSIDSSNVILALYNLERHCLKRYCLKRHCELRKTVTITVKLDILSLLTQSIGGLNYGIAST